MKRLLIALGVCLCLITLSCAIPFQGGPKQEELDTADYGPVPVDIEAEIKVWVKEHLKDPLSTQIEGISKPEKDWWGNLGGLAQPRDIKFGWSVTANINAKNSYGGYIGFQKYIFYFRDGEIKHAGYKR